MENGAKGRKDSNSRLIQFLFSLVPFLSRHFSNFTNKSFLSDNLRAYKSIIVHPRELTFTKEHLGTASTVREEGFQTVWEYFVLSLFASFHCIVFIISLRLTYL